MKRRVIILLYLLAVNLSAFSIIPQLSEKSQVSLLTCSPNTDATYALFGHTGLRVFDDSLDINVVFDYGVFDFNSDNFIYRFVKGETDYKIGDRLFSRFLFEYTFRESGVEEQVLNLTLEEKQSIFDALLINLKPENRVYRYNFFYDNCSTRPRDVVQQNIKGEIEFKPYTSEQTYRDLLDECLILTPWTRFGINLVIGSGADKVINERQKDFLPSYVSTAFNHAEIVSANGEKRPLVLKQTDLLKPAGSALELVEAKEIGYRAPNTPLYVGIVLVMLSVLITYLVRSREMFILGKVFDSILFILAGLAGCIIFFLMFFSEHPCVDANWNLMWLNPLALLFGLFFFVKIASKCVIYYHFVNFATLTLFLLCIPFISQTIEIAFIPYILALGLRSVGNILEYKQMKQK